MAKKPEIKVSMRDGTVTVDYGDKNEQTFATMAEAMQAAYQVARREKRTIRQT
jgi:hypothetical protein